jgi:hypothetical protein
MSTNKYLYVFKILDLYTPAKFNIPRKKRESSVMVHKNILPIINISEDSSATTTITTGEASERHLLDNDNILPNLEEYSPIDDEYSKQMMMMIIVRSILTTNEKMEISKKTRISKREFVINIYLV